MSQFGSSCFNCDCQKGNGNLWHAVMTGFILRLKTVYIFYWLPGNMDFVATYMYLYMYLSTFHVHVIAAAGFSLCASRMILGYSMGKQGFVCSYIWEFLSSRLFLVPSSRYCPFPLSSEHGRALVGLVFNMVCVHLYINRKWLSASIHWSGQNVSKIDCFCRNGKSLRWCVCQTTINRPIHKPTLKVLLIS